MSEPFVFWATGRFCKKELDVILYSTMPPTKGVEPHATGEYYENNRFPTQFIQISCESPSSVTRLATVSSLHALKTRGFAFFFLAVEYAPLTAQYNGVFQVTASIEMFFVSARLSPSDSNHERRQAQLLTDRQ